MFTRFDKALVAPVVGIIFTVLSMLGVRVDVPQEALVGAIVAIAGLATYFVPNKK